MNTSHPFNNQSIADALFLPHEISGRMRINIQLKNLVDNHIKALVTAALKEDLGDTCQAEKWSDGDLTATLIPQDAQASARLICREKAVLCGIPWFAASFAMVDSGVSLSWQINEGESMVPDQTVCLIKGNARSILTAERTAINLLQTLSGTASLASNYVKQLAGLKTKVLDTRKTIPGMRLAQKYAVKIGGAENHRIGLYDGVLIKENHIRAAGSIKKALKQALKITPEDTLLEVEVENLSEMQQAIEAGAKRLLLDNFNLADMRAAVEQKPAAIKLEASGNVRLENLREIAQTGVDYISVGALTKHVQAVDFSLQFTLE